MDDSPLPDHRRDRVDGHLCLTPLGRYQVANHMRQFNCSPDGLIAPDQLPPRSDEIGVSRVYCLAPNDTMNVSD